MKKTIYNVTFLTAIGLVSFGVKAQNNISSILKTGLGDANKLVGAYSTPLLKTLGAGNNAGWFNTAKPHGTLGFDLTIVPTLVLVPSADQSFNVDNLGLNTLKRIDGPETSPTFFGSDKQGPIVGIPYNNGSDTVLYKNTLPAGIGFGAFPVPVAQLAVGVVKNTEIVVRYLPQVDYDQMKMGMIGFGIKHDIKQWIPGMSELPFDLSVMYNYSSFEGQLKIKQLQAEASSSSVYNGDPGRVYNNQKVDIKTTGSAFNLIVSKKIAMFTPYLGLGYQTSTSKLTMKGDFPVTDVNENFEPQNASGTPGYNANNPNHHPLIVRVQQDPIKVEGKLSGFRATGGFRLKMAVITLQADYTFAEYSVVTFGIGVNIQSLVPVKI